MNALIGNFSLCAAVLVAIGTLLVALRAVRSPSTELARTARRGVGALAVLLSVAALALMAAMLQSDFGLVYVAKYTERALPAGYKAAAFWAGQEGSLLLWGWLLAAMGAAFAAQVRRAVIIEQAAAVGTVAAVVGFFAALMLFAANPFEASAVVPADGHGLNPMLQDPGMIAHPPVLFIGYAGFTMPFALLVGVLAARRTDGAWLDAGRPWVLGSWIFLGAGILLGARWAYVELGWGGYWAWDPVENASLLPWLTATALLHSAIGQRHRGMFKRWNAFLAAGTFLLCVFGTWITRSGVVDSVHTFGQSMVGTFFGVFLTVATLASVVLILFRWDALRPDRPLRRLVSREGAFLGANVVLVSMAAITLLGTMFPAISRAFRGEAMSIGQAFYNRGVLPLALALVALMALAPMLAYGGVAARKLLNGMRAPLVLASVVVVASWSLGIRSAWALACGAAGAVLVGSVVTDVVRGFAAGVRGANGNALAAAARLLAANHRRYGSHVVHTGIVMVVAGIAGSSLYNTRATIQLEPGALQTVGRYTVALDALDEARGPNYSAVQATVRVTDAEGRVESLHPQRRFYDKAEDASTEVAIRSNWSEDLYVTLAGWEAGGRLATLQVIVNPMVRWIWAGGVVLTLGAIYCLVPRFGRGRGGAPVDGGSHSMTRPEPRPVVRVEIKSPPTKRPSRKSKRRRSRNRNAKAVETARS